jgi:hypothetical protein
VIPVRQTFQNPDIACDTCNFLTFKGCTTLHKLVQAVKDFCINTDAGNTQKRSESHNKSKIRLLYRGDTVKTDSEP